MKVLIQFLDGEVMEAESEAVHANRMGFPVSFGPETGSNNELAWISMAAIKYVKFLTAPIDIASDEDPRELQGLGKVVMHFSDHETIRTYKDDSFSQEGEGFHLRVWDPKDRRLYRYLVSLHALKGIFFVRQWDSRPEGERHRRRPDSE